MTAQEPSPIISLVATSASGRQLGHVRLKKVRYHVCGKRKTRIRLQISTEHIALARATQMPHSVAECPKAVRWDGFQGNVPAPSHDDAYSYATDACHDMPWELLSYSTVTPLSGDSERARKTVSRVPDPGYQWLSNHGPCVK